MPSRETLDRARLGVGLSQLEFIMAVEQGDDITPEQHVEGMAELIRTNMIRHLQGSWQRAAQSLVDAGIIDQYGTVDYDKLETAVEAMEYA